MNPNLLNAINELQKKLQQYSPKDAVSFKLFVSGSEIQYEFQHKTADQLKSENISMKNISGEWID